MDQRGKVIAGSFVAVALLAGLYELGARHSDPTPLPPQARLGPSASTTTTITTTDPTKPQLVPSSTTTGSVNTGQTMQQYSSAAPGVGTIAVPRTGVGVMESGTALVPTYDTRTAGSVVPGSVPTNATLVPMTDGTSTRLTATDKTTVASTATTYHRVQVTRHHHYEKPGNIHVARGVKHTIAFAAKLPFRLRP